MVKQVNRKMYYKQEDVLSVSEGVIEASPAVYDNYAVVGTRDCKIWGIRLQ